MADSNCKDCYLSEIQLQVYLYEVERNASRSGAGGRDRERSWLLFDEGLFTDTEQRAHRNRAISLVAH